MKYLLIGVFSLLVSTLAKAEAGYSGDECRPIAEKLIRDLIRLDGFAIPELCEVSRFDHCLSITGEGIADYQGRLIYNGQLTYGGNYPNVNDYTVYMDVFCQVLKVEIQRN